LPTEMIFTAARGEGALLWDTAGREYIDYLLGSGPLILGHGHPAVVSAVREQIGIGSTFYAPSIAALELAEAIVRLVPCAQTVRFTGNGSEATFYALRLARAFTGRDLVLKFEGGFHGHHDYALQSFRPAVPTAFPKPTTDSAGIPERLGQTVLVAPFNDIESTTAIAEERADEIAAIIVEPHQRALLPVPGFLSGLRDLADRIGCLLVFDEIVTGFRIAPGGAQELYGVIPDLVALGKVMGGGLPMSAVAGRRDVMELSDPARGTPDRVYISGTLNGNPLSAAAGLATLQVLAAEDVCAVLQRNGSMLMQGLSELGQRLSVPVNVIGHPSFFQVLFGEGPVTNYQEYLATNRKAARSFGLELLRRGLYVNPGGKFYLSAAHTPGLIDRTLERAAEALTAVRDQGLVS
jgi:glutamate-1-semialdehyde 2,1-aminomutase